MDQQIVTSNDNTSLMVAVREAISRIDPQEAFNDDPEFGRIANAPYLTTIRDRTEGRFYPVYENELDLRAIRMASRLLHAEVETALAIQARLVDYTIAGGFDWTITHQSPELAEYLTHAVDSILLASKWTDLEVESFEREICDGEFFGELLSSEGDICLCALEPDCVTEPRNPRQLEEYYDLDFPACWTFGILTKENRSDRPHAYHIVRNESGSDWQLSSEPQIVHWRRNVTSAAKRGYADSFSTYKLLKYAEKVYSNTAIGTAIQAAIAYVVEHAQGTNATQAAALAAARDSQVVKSDPITGESYRKRTIKPGAVVDIKNGGKFHAGMIGANSSQIFIEVMDALLRLSGTKYAMPENMLTGYAGNNNRASSDTAESPFLQGRKKDQRRRGEQFRSMLMKICRVVVESSRQWEWSDVKAGLTVSVQLPEIVSRDPLSLTQALVMQKQNGWISDRMAINELGRDKDDVDADNAEAEEQQRAKDAEAQKATQDAIRPAGAESDSETAPPQVPQPSNPGEAIVTNYGESLQEGWDPLKLTKTQEAFIRRFKDYP